MNADFFNFRDRAFWRSMLTIAIPVAVQNLISSSLNLTDNLMVGQLGEKAIGALSLANQINFLVILFSFGISSGASVFASQYWGARDFGGIRRTQGLSLLLSTISALVFCALGLLIPDTLMGFYTTDSEIRALGSEYLRISALGFPLFAISMSYAMILRSVGRIGLPLVMSIIALVLNVILNYGLIFGLWGFPALGVAGSALGTLIARLVEAMGLVVMTYVLSAPNAGRLKELFSFPKSFLGSYLRTAIPVVANEMGWSLGTTTLMAIYAHMGSAALASMTINDTIVQFIYILIFGSVNAAAIIIGNTVGAGRLKRTRIEARRFARFSVLLGLLCSVGLVALSGVLPGFFKVDTLVRQQSRDLVLVFACMVPFRCFLYHLSVGVLRGAGDTRTALLLEVGGVWLLAVPLALLGSQVFGLSVVGVFALVGLQDVILAVLAGLRLRFGNWIRPITQL